MQKISKQLPPYKCAYFAQSDFFSFRFSFDTIHNTIEYATDSVDVLMRDFDIYRHFYDSTNLDSIINSEENFSHYYIKKYCLNKDTFLLCKQLQADTYNLPLIIELFTHESSAYNSPHSFDTYPVDRISDSSDKLPEHQFNAWQLAEVNFLTNDSVTKILDDQLIDLNYDSVPERLIFYSTKNYESIFSIFENKNGHWIMKNKMKYYQRDYAGISTLQLSGMKNRSILLKLYDCGYVPRKRYFESVFLYVPKE